MITVQALGERAIVRPFDKGDAKRAWGSIRKTRE